jgi:hypothetical protein
VKLGRIDAEDAVLGAVAGSKRVAVDRDDLRAGSEGRRLVAAIALDQQCDDHQQNEGRELAKLLGQRG